MRRYASTIVFAVIMLISELHTRFSNTHTSNWILTIYRPMPDAWNVKFAGLQLIYILFPLAALLWQRNRTNVATAGAFIALGIMDTMLYFWNFKTSGYGSVYVWYFAFWLFFYFGKQMRTKLWHLIERWGR